MTRAKHAKSAPAADAAALYGAKAGGKNQITPVDVRKGKPPIVLRRVKTPARA
jgi:hypothetical protein